MIFPVILPQRLWTPVWTGPLYAVHGSALTRVTATFRVPIPQTPAKANAQVDVWAGLGGLHHANNLCQAGITLQNTSQGVRGFLWAYDYPAAHREILGVQPGQTIRVVAGHLGHRWAAIATDATTHQSVGIGCAAPGGGGWSHAAWITETHAWNRAAPILATTPVWFRGMAVQTHRGVAGNWLQARNPGSAIHWPTRGTAIVQVAR